MSFPTFVPAYRPEPAPGAEISLEFGVKRDVYKAGFHTGRDYASMLDDPLYAVVNGVIRHKAFDSDGYGRYLVLEGDNGRDYYYCHLSTFSISDNVRVVAGNIVGKTGATGNVTGPHLHLEDRPRGGGYGNVRAPQWPIWDGQSFPGANTFIIGQSHPAVTLLGYRLQAWLGKDIYTVGPGPKLSEIDVKNMQKWQLSQGYKGTKKGEAADGYPGRIQWEQLMKDPEPITDKPLTLPVYYPPANATAQWFPNIAGNATFAKVEKLIIHTTEGSGWFNYSSVGYGPHLTYFPGKGWRQHIPLTKSATALADPSSTPVRENQENCIQIEVVGFAKNAANWDDQTCRDIAALIKWLNHYGLPLNIMEKWTGPNTTERLSSSEYKSFKGVLGHQHVSGNDHWDPGQIPWQKIIAYAKGEKPVVVEPAYKIPVNEQEIAAKYLVNVPDAVTAAEQTRLPWWLMCAVLEKESWGKNIFGHDKDGALSDPDGKAIEVTEELWNTFRQLVLIEKKTSNGVGPMQITWPNFFVDMEKRGLKPWVVADNMLYGAEILAGFWKSATGSTDERVRKTGKLYNGEDVYGDSLVEMAAKWRARFTEPPRPPAPVWPKPTNEKPAKNYWTKGKVTALDSSGKVVRNRDAAFRITTVKAIVTGGDKVPASEGTTKWAETEAKFYYKLSNLTTDEPVVHGTKIKVATWNGYVNNGLTDWKKGFDAIRVEGVAVLGVQELSQDSDQKGLTAYAQSKGWDATTRNSAVTIFWDKSKVEKIKSGYKLVHDGKGTWEDGAGGTGIIYKIIMWVNFKVKETGKEFQFQNTHLPPTIEKNGKFDSAKPIRVSIWKEHIAKWCAFLKEYDGPVFGTADVNGDWKSDPGHYMQKEFDKVGVTVCWDEFTDQDTHGSRLIDYVLGKKVVKWLSVKVLDAFGSDHKPVIVEVEF